MMIDIQKENRSLSLWSDSQSMPRILRSAVVSSIINKIFLMLAKRRQRKALRRLDQRLLKDIGMSQLEAEKEANRYFWQ